MRRILLLTAVFFVSSAAQAASDGLIEGAKQCTQYFPTEERSRDIPVHLLAAISTTETGRYHEGLGMAIPWPWTINVEGKGYYFGSKAEAIAATQKFLRQGKRSIDVGCMQVNLKHHASAFRNLNEAFDPATNVGYAAKFLRDNYDEMGNWIKAAAAYHSRTVSRGNSYLARVEKNWTNIVNKVRAAKGQQQVASADPAMKAQAATTRVLSQSSRQSPSAMRSIRMIEVNDVAQARRNDVLVIRTPQQAEVAPNLPAHATISVASADAQSDMMVKTMPTRMHMMSIDKAPKSSISSGNKTFVFSN